MSFTPGTKLSHTAAAEKATVLTGGYVMSTRGKYVGQRMLLRDWIILADGETIDEDYIPLDVVRNHEIGTSILWRKNEDEWRLAVQMEREVLQLHSVYMEDGEQVEEELERFPTMEAWGADLEGGDFTHNPPLQDAVGTMWSREVGGVVYHAMQKRHCVIELKQVRGNHTIYCDKLYASYADWWKSADKAVELDTATDEEGWRQYMADQAAEPYCIYCNEHCDKECSEPAIPPLPRSRLSSIDMTAEELSNYRRLCEEDMGPDCNFCDLESGCDGDHSAEYGEQRLRRPTASTQEWKPVTPTLTEKQAQENLAHAGRVWFTAADDATKRW
jgi:hypothetical protein